MTITELFTDHPDTVGETYLGHMVFAAKFSGLLALASGAALVHAIFPFLCQTTASRIVKRLANLTTHRGVHQTG